MMASFFIDGRFTDAWVVDRTLFEHLSGGACSCCGVTHQNIGALMQDCSDLETDDGRKERKSPWPPAMSDEVWTARVKLRASMKEEMPRYKQFWEKHAKGFTQFWMQMSEEGRRRTLSMPIDEIPVTFEGKYDLRGAYSAVMGAVNEQLRNFDKTGIHGDGRSTAELAFEEGLKVHRGAYLGKSFVKDMHAKTFFDLCQQAGGPRLLPSKPRENRADSPVGNKDLGPSAPKSNNEVDVAEGDAVESEGQMVFRYMFDKAIRTYEAGVGEGGPTEPRSPARRKH